MKLALSAGELEHALKERGQRSRSCFGARGREFVYVSMRNVRKVG